MLKLKSKEISLIAGGDCQCQFGCYDDYTPDPIDHAEIIRQPDCYGCWSWLRNNSHSLSICPQFEQTIVEGCGGNVCNERKTWRGVTYLSLSIFVAAGTLIAHCAWNR